jgi:hypothetical protein
LQSNHARGGSKAAMPQGLLSEPPRRVAPPLLTQEGVLRFSRLNSFTASVTAPEFMWKRQIKVTMPHCLSEQLW